jgi:hypothetical protein
LIEDQDVLGNRSAVMTNEVSAVLEFGAPEPGECVAVMEDKLRFHTDCWDLSVDLRAGLSDIVVIDARSRDAYVAGHIPGAISFPHREMNAEAAARLDRTKVYVVYCDGIDWWRRDGHPVTASYEPGSLLAAE